jgi:hypothetical protein
MTDMNTPIRNRIKRHVRMKAADLVPHELNPRLHTDAQREALQALYAEVGFARSLLAYELPDGRLKLIDGHLRRALDPAMEVEVEVLDVGDDEARALLLSLDPLILLAEYDRQMLDQLRAVTETDNATLQALWAGIAAADQDVQERLKANREESPSLPEQFLVLLECASEEEQVALLERFSAEGLRCRALNA